MRVCFPLVFAFSPASLSSNLFCLHLNLSGNFCISRAHLRPPQSLITFWFRCGSRGHRTCACSLFMHLYFVSILRTRRRRRRLSLCTPQPTSLRSRMIRIRTTQCQPLASVATQKYTISRIRSQIAHPENIEIRRERRSSFVIHFIFFPPFSWKRPSSPRCN